MMYMAALTSNKAARIRQLEGGSSHLESLIASQNRGTESEALQCVTP